MNKQETIQQIRDYSARLCVTLGSVTDLADSMMRDCIQQFKQRGIFRKELKYHANLAIRESAMLQSSYRQRTKEVDQLYLDFLDEIQDDIKADLDKLYFAVKQAFDRKMEPESDTYAMVMLACILTETNGRGYARYKQLLEQITGAHLGLAMSPICPDKVMFQWQQVAEIIYGGTFPSYVAQEPAVINGITIIAHKLFDLDWLEDRAEKVIPATNNE